VDALIFDFDGVVIDSEPIHLQCFQQVLKPYGVTLTREQYYAKYLGYDDHDCFAAALADAGRQVDEGQISEMISAKSKLVRRIYAEDVEALPGAVQLISTAAAAEIPIAVCSGALRAEIELASKSIGVWDYFATVVSPQDVSRGKPDPQGYLLTLERLRQVTARPIAAERCVVVEDSPAGIEAAKKAGTRVLAVTTSYPADQLRQADRIVESLADVTLGTLEDLL